MKALPLQRNTLATSRSQSFFSSFLISICVLGLSACSSSTPAPASNAAPASATASAPAGSQAGPCSLVTQAEVEIALG